MDIHAEAELFVLPESDGGRKSPFFSGYRPQFRFDGRDNDCSITLLNGDQLGGGETGMVALSFYRPELQSGRFSIGSAFAIAEGARVVGRGRITLIHDTSMLRESPD